MSSQPPLVLVTGVSGFLASWIAHALLKLGYRVRGTVRSMKNEAKVKHLRDLCPGSTYKIELVEADLTSDMGWNEAVIDCDYILHTASPFVIEEPKDKNLLINPAVEGTLRVLRAASNTPRRLRRVVVTSSNAAISFGQDLSTGKVFNESDWTVIDDKKFPIGGYVESKTRAERAAWDFVESLPDDRKFELATVNPTLILGPMISSTLCASASIVENILLNKMPGLASIDLEVCSIFDVVKAHLLAMTKPEAAGKRFLVQGANLTFVEFGKILEQEFRPQGYKPTSMVIPDWLVRIFAFFDSKAAAIVPYLGTRRNLDPVNTRTVLGLTLDKDCERMVKEMAYGGISVGAIPDKSKDGAITKNYTRPEINLEGIPRP